MLSGFGKVTSCLSLWSSMPKYTLIIYVIFWIRCLCNILNSVFCLFEQCRQHTEVIFPGVLLFLLGLIHWKLQVAMVAIVICFIDYNGDRYFYYRYFFFRNYKSFLSSILLSFMFPIDQKSNFCYKFFFLPFLNVKNHSSEVFVLQPEIVFQDRWSVRRQVTYITGSVISLGVKTSKWNKIYTITIIIVQIHFNLKTKSDYCNPFM